MKMSSVSETKNKLSSLIDEVKAGEVIVVTDRGIPVARLMPIGGDAECGDSLIEGLVRMGVVKRGEPLVLEGPPPTGPETRRAGVLEALLEERRSGR